MTSCIDRFKQWAILSILVWQGTAGAAMWPFNTSRGRWYCAGAVALVASTALGLTWLGYAPSSAENDLTPLGGGTELVAPVEVERTELEVRQDNFAALFNAQQHAQLNLTTAAGSAPQLHLFNNPAHSAYKRFIQNQVANGVKAEIRKKFPDIEVSTQPGLHVAIERIQFSREAGDQIRVVVRASYFQLTSEHTYSAADLVSGNPIRVPFTPHRQPAQETGTATAEAFFVLRYDAESGKFEITQGQGAFSVVIPGRVNERDVASLPTSYTSAVNLSARR